MLEPVAQLIGGFWRPEFLEVVHAHQPTGEWAVLASDRAFVPLTIVDREIGFVGHEDLIDYRSPCGPGAVDVMAEAFGSMPSHRIRIDSLPAEAAALVEEAALAAGRSPQRADHMTTARLMVPDDFDAYLASLSKKERHELRRKRRRYEEDRGPVEVVREHGPGPLLDEFIRLHRAAAGDKGDFMTDQMAGFFRDVHRLDGWHVDALVDGGGLVTAAAFGFEDSDAYYLYNSGFDPSLRHVSPGIVLLGALVEQVANTSRSVFDFLKGDETYKYRLGAQARQLSTVTA